MARPNKFKKIEKRPVYKNFYTNKKTNSEDEIVMSLEEYECIRLMDNENMTQLECAELMQVARTTITRLYNSARKKQAEHLVTGNTLKIRGGNYFYCGRGLGNGPRNGQGNGKGCNFNENCSDCEFQEITIDSSKE